jgi:NTP pyrophosphatase (non-canonical NTP hydrolase)
MNKEITMTKEQDFGHLLRPPLTISQWCVKAHNLSREKGWYEGAPREVGTLYMLMVSEISEALEEVRAKRPAMYTKQNGEIIPITDEYYTTAKPEGELIELADLAIRLFDYCGARGLDLERAIEIKHEFNKTRPHRHGGKAF